MTSSSDIVRRIDPSIKGSWASSSRMYLRLCSGRKNPKHHHAGRPRSAPSAKIGTSLAEKHRSEPDDDDQGSLPAELWIRGDEPHPDSGHNPWCCSGEEACEQHQDGRARSRTDTTAPCSDRTVPTGPTGIPPKNSAPPDEAGSHLNAYPS